MKSSWREQEKEAAHVILKEKIRLAELLGWPPLENLSWYEVWAGGWCLHGRAARSWSQDAQRSMNFEVEERRPLEALRAAIDKVKAHPERLEEKVRWFCPEHGWEEVLPRGQMSHGCPICEGYHCEPVKEE